MAKPNINFSVAEIKTYIRANKLNVGQVKLSLTRPQLIAGLKLIDHFDDSVAKIKRKRVKKAQPPTKPKMTKEDDVRPIDKKVSTPPKPPPVSKPSKGIKVGKPPPNLEKAIDKLSKQYIEEIKKMKPFKKLADIQSTFKKYEKKIYDFIGFVDGYEQLRNYFDDNWLDKVSEAIPDGRKKPPPPPVSKLKKPVASTSQQNRIRQTQCMTAGNNANSVISFLTEAKGKFKDDPSFKSKKDYMESIDTIKRELSQPVSFRLCTKKEQETMEKAMKLHNESKFNKSKK